MEILIFILPLISFLICKVPLFYRYINLICVLNPFLIVLSFLISLFYFIKLFDLNDNVSTNKLHLININYFDLDWSLKLDFFVFLMICLVTLTSSIIILYSIYFYKKNKSMFENMGFISLSTFGILVFVSSNNLIHLFLGWQIVIMSSYILVSNINNKGSSVDNSKIFFYNRISDLGIFFSIFILYSLTKSYDFEIILNDNYYIRNNNFNLMGFKLKISEFSVFLLFFSYLLRFRQFFITNCIYDLRNINTPALTQIFCSIYIPAGLYILIRFLPLVHNTHDFLNIMIILGFIITMILIFLSLSENNHKLLISYIVCSQLSIITFFIGFKAYEGAIFYLMTTSLSITMIFLCMGTISSKLGNENDIRKMGSLFYKLPTTFLFMIIAIFSIIGIPYFVGFYSKELIMFSSYISYQNYMLFPLLFNFIVSLMFSYILIKNILLIFWSNNNCNIHYYNKIEESSFLLKFIFLILALILVTSGWFFGHIFSSSDAKKFWYLILNINIQLPFIQQNSLSPLIKNSMIYTSIFGILIAFFNYTIIPILRNSIKLKYNKVFVFYIKQFLKIH